MKKKISLLTVILFAVSIAMMACKAEVHTHTFAEEWKTDENFHWKECECGEIKFDAEHIFGEWEVTKEATEEDEGSKEKSCSVCEYKVTEEIAKLEHTHKFSLEWTSDETNHWHASTCGHEVTEGKTAHTFGDWTITKAATEEETGSKERVCDVCKYKDTEVIEKLEHKHKFASEWTSDETNHWHASTCGHEVTEGKTAHTFGDWITTKAATCTEEGIKTGVCEVCKKEVTEKIDAKEHNFSIWKVTTDPTDTTEGTSKRVCDICNFEETKQIIPIPEGFRFVQGGTVTGALPAWLYESAFHSYKGVFIESRTVTLSDFYMGKYEVTQEEYASVMAGQKVTVNGTDYALESNPSCCTADSTSYTIFNGDVQEKRPVEGVTWYDSVWYCNALSEKEGLAKAYNIEVTQVKQASGKTGYYIYSANVTLNKNANGYRLPTEAEWEYAARGGDSTETDWNYVFSGADTAEGVSHNYFKNAGLDSVGWYCYNNITGITGGSDVTDNVSGKGTHQVGKKDPNRLGLFDMSGNVWEWCYDWDEEITTTTPADGPATSGSYRVIRGGSWFYSAGGASVCRRFSSYPYSSSNQCGFRVVRQAN